jgi:hypothetical protein
MDIGDADIIVTQSGRRRPVGRQARLRLRAAAEDEVTIYEVWPGDSGPDDPIVGLDP